jgi:hypothetical protein
MVESTDLSMLCSRSEIKMDAKRVCLDVLYSQFYP